MSKVKTDLPCCCIDKLVTSYIDRSVLPFCCIDNLVTCTSYIDRSVSTYLFVV